MNEQLNLSIVFGIIVLWELRNGSEQGWKNGKIEQRFDKELHVQEFECSRAFAPLYFAAL